MNWGKSNYFSNIPSRGILDYCHVTFEQFTGTSWMWINNHHSLNKFWSNVLNQKEESWFCVFARLLFFFIRIGSVSLTSTVGLVRFGCPSSQRHLECTTVGLSLATTLLCFTRQTYDLSLGQQQVGKWITRMTGHDNAVQKCSLNVVGKLEVAGPIRIQLC